MSEHFNQLTPAEHERLALLIEECAEVQQIACKILRHGYESYNPNDPDRTDNRTLLSIEIGHLEHALHRMQTVMDYSPHVAHCSEELKAKTVKQYLHHQ